MERAIPILLVDDPEAATRFYVESLGFRLVSEAHYPLGDGEVTIVGV